MSGGDLDLRVRELETKAAHMERQIMAVAQELHQLRQERKHDYAALKEQLEILHHDMSTWSGARRALAWTFGAFMTLMSVLVAVWALAAK